MTPQTLNAGAPSNGALPPAASAIVAVSAAGASPSNKQGRAGGPGRGHALKGVLAALIYGTLSIANVFLNKAIFRMHEFKLPATLVTGQTVFSLVLLLLSKRFKLLDVADLDLRVLYKVGPLSVCFLTKIVLDMQALVLINIPMYGVLKTSTTPFVMALDYVMRGKVAPMKIQLPVYFITLGGLVAGYGDLTFDMLGYTWAIASAIATAAYVVIVGKLGDELRLDSFSLLLYNCIWSTPLCLLLMLFKGEFSRLMDDYADSWRTAPFYVCFLTACASAFLLNCSTYWCTLVNDSLTTSVVGRTKSIFQGIGGLFAFGDVEFNVMNLLGLLINSSGVGWYAYEKWAETTAKVKSTLPVASSWHAIHRDNSCITFRADRANGRLS